MALCDMMCSTVDLSRRFERAVLTEHQSGANHVHPMAGLFRQAVYGCGIREWKEIMRKVLPQVRKALQGPSFKSTPQQDIFLASYPRSGNTWLRAILFHARIGRAPQNLSELDFGIPDEHQKTPARKLLAPKHSTERFIVKTHTPYRLKAPYRNVACIVRDPRDVIPSYFRYLSRMRGWENEDFENFAIGCISGTVWPGSWFEHLASWQFFLSRHPDRGGIFTYERLVARDAAEIERLGQTLLLPSDIDLGALFQTYDLDQMHELEVRGNRSNEAPTGFIGNGFANTSRREVVETAIRQHAPHWSDFMTTFGYVL